jgi:hypothetical protein
MVNELPVVYTALQVSAAPQKRFSYTLVRGSIVVVFRIRSVLVTVLAYRHLPVILILVRVTIAD